MTAAKTENSAAARAAINPRGLPLVVLAGRANVGKSTLFNRIVRRNRAIVSAIAGTTRDLIFAPVSHAGRDFMIVDSGGLELGSDEPITRRIIDEALNAAGAAAVVIFVVDMRQGLNPFDCEALALIRKLGRPFLVAVNKADRPNSGQASGEFYKVGAEQLFFVSAAHGLGAGELLDEIAARLPPAVEAESGAPDLKVALIGRPNVGKSTLLNRLAGFKRSLVDERPGTTRDPVDVRLDAGGREVLLIDTAGIRRRTRIDGELEHFAVGRGIGTIRRADVLILVVDATEAITDQDARLASLVDREDKALMIVCNKWDAAAKAGRKVALFARNAHERFPFLDHAPLIFASALTGDGTDKIIPAALKAGDCFRSQVQTAQLNRILAEARTAMDPPLIGRRRLKLLYATQVGTAPPRIAFFSNLERDIPVHYMRFLQSRFIAALNLSGTPLRLQFRRAPGGRMSPRADRHLKGKS